MSEYRKPGELVTLHCPVCGQELNVPITVATLPRTSDDIRRNQVTVQVSLEPGPNLLMEHECVREPAVGVAE